jgi:hypothetical protein
MLTKENFVASHDIFYSTNDCVVLDTKAQQLSCVHLSLRRDTLSVFKALPISEENTS